MSNKVIVTGAAGFIGARIVENLLNEGKEVYILDSMPINKALTSSFQAVFKSPNLWPYVGMQTLAGIIYIVPTICTCGLGGIITLPMLGIYSQHLAYNKGIIN